MRFLILGLLLVTAASGLAVASVDLQLVSMAPQKTTLFVGIDMAGIASSRSGEYVDAHLLSDPYLARLITMAGLDDRQGIQQILFAGLGGQTANDPRGVIIARRTFDPAHLRSVARGKGATITRYQGESIMVQGEGGSAVGLAFPETCGGRRPCNR